MNHIYIFLFALMSCTACEKQNIESFENKSTVVQAYLHAGKGIDSLKVTQSYSYSQVDSNIIRIDDLDVSISTPDSVYMLHAIGNGLYQNTDLIIEADQEYELHFTRDELDISATTYVPNKTEIELSTTQVLLEKIESGSFGGGFGNLPDPIEVNWDNTTGAYFYVNIQNIEANPEYINENIAEIEAENGEVIPFNTNTTPQVSDFYALNARQFKFFGTHRLIVYSVNPDYAALYESAGNSTLSLEEPPSNIINGLGIFTGINSDTAYIEVLKQ